MDASGTDKIVTLRPRVLSIPATSEAIAGEADDLSLEPIVCRSPLLRRAAVPSPKAVHGAMPPCRAPVSTVLMLLYTSLLVLGVSWAYDFPGAMFSFLSDRFGTSYSSNDNQLLYSVYNWPNVVIVLLAGFAIDQWVGISRSTVCLTLLVLIGQCLFSLAVQWRLFWLAGVGRFVFGLGGEAIKVAQSTWIVLLSDASNMSWRFGVVLSVSRLAGAVNFALTPTIGEASILAAVWLGTVIAAISCGAAFALVRMYKSRMMRLKLDGIDTAAAGASVPRPGVRAQLIAMWIVLRSFPGTVWLQFAICVFYHVGVLLLYQIASTLLQQTGARYTERTASLLVAVPAFISIFGTPWAGHLVDKYGNALNSILVASCLLILSHLLLIAYVLEWFVVSAGAAGLAVVIVALVTAGVSYSMATASIWPLVPFLLPPSQVAIGYGAMASVENLGVALMTVILSSASNASGSPASHWPHVVSLLLLMFTAGVAVVCVAIQIHTDRTAHGGRLNKRAVERQLAVDSVALDDRTVPAIS
jgi:MFS family permease